MGWNMSKHVETTNGRKWLEKLTFRLVKHVCAWNLPCYLLGHLTPLMWNPLGKRLFCSFLINHLSRSMVLAVQRTFLSNPKPSHVFASRGFPKDWTLNHINFNPIPQKPSQPPKKKHRIPKIYPKNLHHLILPYLSSVFSPGPGAPGRVPGASAPGKSRRAAPGLEWCGAGLAESGGAGAAPPWDPQRFRGSLGTKFGFLLGNHRVPMQIFGWKAILNRDIRDCGSAQWCAWGKAFSSLAKPLSTICFFNAVCTLLFCSGIQLTIQNTPKMEVHDGLRHWVCFFVCFLWVFDSLGLIQTNPNQIWFILPPRHSCQVIIKKKRVYGKHAQHSLGMCNFPFQVWSLWGCKIMFLVKDTFPSNDKWCSCPSRAQLGSLKGVLYFVQRNGVIERILTYFQNMVQLSKEAADSTFFLVSKIPSNKWCAFQTGGSWVSLKGVLHFFLEMVLLSNIKTSWASLRGMLHF